MNSNDSLVVVVVVLFFITSNFGLNSCSDDKGLTVCSKNAVFTQNARDLIHLYDKGDTLKFVYSENQKLKDTLIFEIMEPIEKLNTASVKTAYPECQWTDYTAETLIFRFNPINNNHEMKVEYIADDPGITIAKMVIQFDTIFLLEAFTEDEVFFSIGNKKSPDYVEEYSVQSSTYKECWTGFEQFEKVNYQSNGMAGINMIEDWDAWYSPHSGVIKLYFDFNTIELVE